MATLRSKVRSHRIARCPECGQTRTVPHNLVGADRCPRCRVTSRLRKPNADEKNLTHTENPRD
jgi:uncharacterized paraquat-inducible protein A